MSDNQSSGRSAEALALRHLCDQGLRLLTRNWSCRSGELDLVMRDGDTVVFVEVRYRQQSRWGSAAESVGRSKQQRVIRAAEHFLLTHPRLANRPCRFDVIAAEGNPADPSSYTWIREAFTC